jgi:hypothetical protein
MQAAVDRRFSDEGGLVPDEGLTPIQALNLFSGPLERPAEPPAPIRLGLRADFCLLDLPLEAALRDLRRGNIRATIRAGRVIHCR